MIIWESWDQQQEVKRKRMNLLAKEIDTEEEQSRSCERQMNKRLQGIRFEQRMQDSSRPESQTKNWKALPKQSLLDPVVWACWLDSNRNNAIVPNNAGRTLLNNAKTMLLFWTMLVVLITAVCKERCWDLTGALGWIRGPTGGVLCISGPSGVYL